jgi:protein O-GlcNAc transferase
MSNGSGSRFSGFLKRFGSKESMAEFYSEQVRTAEGLVAQGERDQAVAVYSKLIQLQPEQPLAHYKRGNLLKDQGQLEAALVDYDQAVKLDPNYAYALCNRGFTLTRLGRLEAALDSYDRALANTPNDVIAISNRADVLRQLKRSDAAVAAYGAAIAIDPNHLQSYCNRGSLLTDLQRFTEARSDFERAVQISTQVADVYFGRARLLHLLRQFDEAMVDYDRALELDPKYVAARAGRAGLFVERDQWQEAVEAYDAALTIDPNFAEAHKGRATPLQKLHRHPEAVRAYERALAIDPQLKLAHGLYLHAKLLGCDWDGLAAEIARCVAGVRNGEPISTPFPLLAISEDPAVLHKVAQIWVNEEAPGNSDFPALQPRRASDKLRIGYFSNDLRDHPVALLTCELFEIHDRSRFETVAFSYGDNQQSQMRQRLEKAFDRFIDLKDSSDVDLTRAARSLELDIAVDLGGHTAGGRPLSFAHRIAPVQATYLGFAGTFGAPYFDYLIADSTVIPPEHQPHYSEKIAYLPHCYLPNDTTRVIGDPLRREDLGLPADAFVFCSFNNSFKFTPEVFSSWMRILSRVPGSVLWLAKNNSTAADNLAKEAELRGIDPGRLIFAGFEPSLKKHLARLQLADLFLDTLPYNAHTSAIDALWAGVPLITRIGGSFAGRVTASALRAIGLPEFITTNMDEYEQVAVQMATHPTRLAELRQRLWRNRLTTPLFDSQSFVRSLEALYTGMYSRYRAGLPPDHIRLPG